MPPKNIVTNVNATDGRGGAFAPTTTRRLFDLTREAEPAATVGRKKTKAPAGRVVLQLPDNGAGREGAGPGIYTDGRVTKIVHRAGCPWPRLPCAGGADCDRVPIASDLSDADLRGRIADLEHHVRVDDALPVRVAELEAARAELSVRTTAPAPLNG